MIEIKVKMTKERYRAWDSYNRHQRWFGRNLLNMMKAQYRMPKM